MKPLKPFDSISYNGKTIHIVDISNTKPEEAIAVLAEVQAHLSLLPDRSALVLTDASNAVFNSASAKAMKDFSVANTPRAKAVAVVGADGLRAVLLETIRILTRREIKSFKTRQAALTWLATMD